MVTLEDIDTISIRCPFCGSYDYDFCDKLYDEVWISLKYQCLVCKGLFQVNYTVISIDKLNEPNRVLTAIISYYQHSQGGKGKYIEKKIASAFSTSSLNIKLSELPIWLEFPEVHKKKGIFTLNGLSSEERRLFRTTPWHWIGNRDESTDVGNILKDEKTMVLVEVKNRVDSGGASARREILTSQKFGVIIDYLLNNKKLYQKENEKFSLTELLKLFNISSLELYIGILFDIGDSPATLKSDKRRGYYASSREGFTFLRNKIEASSR